MNKHAYLIIAHEQLEQLSILIEMLDDARNDIFLHIDKKFKTFDFSKIKNRIKYSNIYLVDNPIKVTWGAYSQIESELLLLEKATNIGSYSYYHLISGADLPIKNQNYIHEFFEKNNGKEFVRFFSDNIKNDYDRVSYYYHLQEIIGRDNNLIKKLLNKIQYYSIKVQKILGIDRGKGIVFKKGTNWFSITDELARFVLSKKNWIRNTFRYTFCCDEIFLQTIIFNSKFKDKLYWNKFDNNCKAIMRFIDWDRGCHYTFRENDYNQLISSEFLWARKFNMNTDNSIIVKLKEVIKVH